jgi:hypothetical protein
VLGGLASYLPEVLLREALAVVRIEKDQFFRAEALVAIAPYLPPSLMREALAATLEIKVTEEHYQALALERLALHLEHVPVALLYSLWCETLHSLSSSTRGNLLSDIQALSPVITMLGGKEALIATAQAIIEVGKWFP